MIFIDVVVYCGDFCFVCCEIGDWYFFWIEIFVGVSLVEEYGFVFYDC